MLFQDHLRSILRPIARLARRVLTVPEPEKVFQLTTVLKGTARSCRMVLPSPSVLTERIVNGEFEPVCTKVVEQLVSRADVCFDIGGHYGYYTFSLAKLAAEGHVHTFEPVPDHVKRLRTGVEESGLGNITIHESAVSCESGKMQLRVAGEGSDDSMAYLAEYGGVDTEAAREQYVSFSEITVVSESLDSMSIDPPRFIKIDAEGAEAQILLGGIQLIRREHPRLMIEVHGIREALQCSEVLTACDYIAVILSERKETLPVLWVHRDDHDALRLVEQALGFTPMTVFGAADDRPAFGQSR